MNRTQETTHLKASQNRQAAAVLAQAFQHDPMMRYVIPDDTRRARLLPWFCGTVVRYCLPYGEIRTTPELDGIACWLPPGTSMTNSWGMLRSGMILAPLRLGPAAFGRFVGLATYMEAVHKRIVPAPHWYLWAFGVDPSRWGQGIGGSLLEPVLAQAEADGLPCYLETHNERNVKFYEKRGFVVVEAGEPRGLRVWAMLRTPHDPKTAVETQPEPPGKERA